MNVTALAYRTDRKDGFSLVCFGTVVVVAGMAMTIAMNLSMGPGFFSWIPLFTAGFVGMSALVPGVIRVIDQGTKLTVDESGITDHRAKHGLRRIPWDSIQSIDCEIGSGGANLIVYQVSNERKIEVTKIKIGDLEGGASQIFTEIKKLRLQLEVQHGAQVDSQLITEVGITKIKPDHT